jgi:hypothetical protein
MVDGAHGGGGQHSKTGHFVHPVVLEDLCDEWNRATHVGEPRGACKRLRWRSSAKGCRLSI